MLRIALTFIILAALGAGAAWMANHPGVISAEWYGYRLEATASVALVILAVLVLTGVVLIELIRLLLGSPSAFGGFLAKRRERKGLTVLGKGLVAVAAGDAREARRLAKQTERLLDNPALTLLLSAQAAQLDGDEQAAEGYFRAMLDDKDTAFLGLRGLMSRAMDAGDEVAALEMARRAFSLRPKTPWVLDALFELECKAGEWARAEAVVAQTRKTGMIDAPSEKRRQAVLYFLRSIDAEKSGRADDAVAFAERAIKQAPELGVAAVQAARLLHERGKERRAFKILGAAWAKAPHPQLLDCFRVLADGLKFEDRLKRFRSVISDQPDHPESRLALAEIAFEVHDYDLARKTLEALAKDHPQPRVFGLLAQLEQVSRSDAAAAAVWLKQAQDAPLDPIWICSSCGQRVRQWTAHCPSCQTFDSLEWRSPDDERLELPSVIRDMPVEPEEKDTDVKKESLPVEVKAEETPQQQVEKPALTQQQEPEKKTEEVEVPPLPDVPLLDDDDDRRKDPTLY